MVEIREWTSGDREEFFEMASAFYKMPAVLHKIPREHHRKTFDASLRGDDRLGGFMILSGGETAGYLLTAVTWSNEAGGECVWLEEIYLKEEFRGLGIGSAAIKAVMDAYPQAKRFRLEYTAENGAAARLYRRLGFEEMRYGQMVLER